MSALWNRLLFARATFVITGLTLMLYRLVSGTGVGDDLPPAHLGIIVLAGIVGGSLFASSEQGK